MKKKIIICLLILFVILNIPIKYGLKDGGSIVYKSVLWKYTKVHSMNALGGYNEGVIFSVLGITIVDDVKEGFPDLTDNSGEVIDESYDDNTSFSLNETVWKSEDESVVYQFNKPNVKGGCVGCLDNVSLLSVYYLYTDGNEFEKFEDFFNASQDSLKDGFNDATEGMNGVPFGLCIDLDVGKTSESDTATQSLYEYYGIYTKDKMVIAEIASDNNIIFLNKVNE